MIDTKSIISSGEQKIKKNDLVIAKGTGSSRFFPKGEERPTHRILAERLKADGKVTISGKAPSKPLKARVQTF